MKKKNNKKKDSLDRFMRLFVTFPLKKQIDLALLFVLLEYLSIIENYFLSFFFINGTKKCYFSFNYHQ